MKTLKTECWTVKDGRVEKGTLEEFTKYIETTTRPNGVGPKYYPAQMPNGRWAVARWVTWGGPERFGMEFDSFEGADQEVQTTYVYDILNNPDQIIHLNAEDAYQELADAKVEGQYYDY